MKTFLILGRNGFILAKCEAETEEQVRVTLEKEKDDPNSPIIFGRMTVNRFIYDQWKHHGERIEIQE